MAEIEDRGGVPRIEASRPVGADAGGVFQCGVSG